MKALSLASVSPIVSHAVFPKLSLSQAGQRTSDYTAVSGHRFRLGEDYFQLADVISPDETALLSNARQYAGQSRRALQSILDQEDFVIDYLDVKDRWGDAQVRLPLLGGEGASGETLLLRRGAVRVMPTSRENNNLVQKTRLESFFAIEATARRQEKGLWELPWYRVRNANNVDDARDCVGSFQLFTGRIIKVGNFSGRWFLNFGDDYKSDVTATISGYLERRWRQAGLELNDLEGRSVSFRGFIEWINGPSIALKHLQWLQIDER